MKMSRQSEICLAVVLFFVTACTQSAKEEWRQSVHNAGDAIYEDTEAVKEKAKDVGNAITNTATNVGTKVRRKIHDMTAE